MSQKTIARNSTKRLAFKWMVKRNGVMLPFDLTGCSVQLLVDDEWMESTPATPVRIATLTGVITDPTAGEAYFLPTTEMIDSARTLYAEAWVTDSQMETWRLSKEVLVIEAGLR